MELVVLVLVQWVGGNLMKVKTRLPLLSRLSDSSVWLPFADEGLTAHLDLPRCCRMDDIGVVG
jgi:hypothetical protein